MLGEVAIERGALDELGVRADAHDLAVLEHNNLVAIHHGRESVRDDEQRAVDRDAVDGLAHHLLVGTVEA